MRQKMAEMVHRIQDEICLVLREIDGVDYREDEWTREEGGGGRSRVFSGGKVFEKAGVNVSIVHGTLSPQAAKSMGGGHELKGADLDFFATGISLVLHPLNPMAPTVHANYRYFERGDGNKPGSWWFGGGADLTPSYLFEEDAIHFHQILKDSCDRHDVADYDHFKQWCDDYFHIKHRGERRGLGGLFFDDINKASRPFDKSRNGIVVSEGGAIYTLERLDDALARNANILGEIIGYRINSDASDYVLPNPERQAECMRAALDNAGLSAHEVDLVNTHATSTPQGDIQECKAIAEVFGSSPTTYINNTKSFIGHAMGAAGALELAGNLPSFQDHIIHPTINVDELDPECALANLVINEPRKVDAVKVILNNSFGMLGINSALIVRNFEN